MGHFRTRQKESAKETTAKAPEGIQEADVICGQELHLFLNQSNFMRAGEMT